MRLCGRERSCQVRHHASFDSLAITTPPFTLWYSCIPSYSYPNVSVPYSHSIPIISLSAAITAGWNEDWTTRAVQPITTIFKDATAAAAAVLDSNGGNSAGSISGNSVVCDEWIDHPVLVVQRDTFANFFHDRSPPSMGFSYIYPPRHNHPPRFPRYVVTAT